MKRNLMNKWIVAAGAMMIAVALSLSPASADNKKPKKTETQKNPPVAAPVLNGLGKVSLACEPYNLGSDVAAFVKITNTTGQTIPKGTKINWQTKLGLKGTATVNDSAGLPSGKSITDSNDDWTKRGACTAYFYKNVK